MKATEYHDPMQGNREHHWPVIVIGAGPAGAATAVHLARAGVRTLVLDRATFPRDTVCGCCLNQPTLDHLKQLGLTDHLRASGAPAFGRLNLHAQGRIASCPLPPGLALSRRALDSMIVDAAVRAGATVRTGVSARVSADRTDSSCVIDTSEGRLHASIAVIADGLHGSSLNAHRGFLPRTTVGARMGIAAHIPPSSDLPPGVIAMSCTSRGYVGVARMEQGRMICAAAIDPAWVRATGGPASAVDAIMREAGGPACILDDATWMGTGRLTRHRLRVGGHRMFIVGDAAGYVEPFTGEGICRALESAALVTQFVIRSERSWQPEHATAWERAFARAIRRRQHLCRLISFGLRRPAVVRTAMMMLRMAPWLATPVVRSISRPAPQAQDAVA